MKKSAKASQDCLRGSDEECRRKHSTIWAITAPAGLVLAIWICATTAYRMESGRLQIELAIQEYIQIKADIDKR